MNEQSTTEGYGPLTAKGVAISLVVLSGITLVIWQIILFQIRDPANLDEVQLLADVANAFLVLTFLLLMGAIILLAFPEPEPKAEAE